MKEKLADARAREIVSEAVYFISIGSNDYMGGYLGNPKMQENYNPEQYIGMVIGNLTQAIQVSLFSFRKILRQQQLYRCPLFSNLFEVSYCIYL